MTPNFDRFKLPDKEPESYDDQYEREAEKADEKYDFEKENKEDEHDLLGRTLALTLKGEWFDMVASGEKREEYRARSPWIMSRLEGKQYDTVRFRNGYSPYSSVCVCEYLGWKFGYGSYKWGGGSTPGSPLVIINLGKVLKLENCNFRTTKKRPK